MMSAEMRMSRSGFLYLGCTFMLKMLWPTLTQSLNVGWSLMEGAWQTSWTGDIGLNTCRRSLG